MSHTYVALLRGINVGGNSKVEMSKLKQSFSDLGFFQITTYINSGNVIFTTEKSDIHVLSSDIETKLASDFGFSIKVLVKTADTIKLLVYKIPLNWTNDSNQRTDVIFLWENYANVQSLDLIKFNSQVDDLRYIDGAIIWHLERKNYNKSFMRQFIGTLLYKNMTARNINTVRKLSQLLDK